MTLPFTHDDFLNVFGAYNGTHIWGAAALWAVTTGSAAGWLRRGTISYRTALALLAVHWVWSGLLYHVRFFSAINPAAIIFGLAFVAQAGWFAYLATQVAEPPARIKGFNGLAGVALILYGLAYPFIMLAAGLRYPRLPLFAVPCPTTLVTAGVLLILTGLPRSLRVIPLAWACLAASAAFQLGIRPDLALIPAAVALAFQKRPHALGMRTASA